MNTEIVDDVPSSAIEKVLQDYRDSGAIAVKAEPKPDGTWRVIATFDREPLA
jgi:hypothetical protein